MKEKKVILQRNPGRTLELNNLKSPLAYLNDSNYIWQHTFYFRLVQRNPKKRQVEMTVQLETFFFLSSSFLLV